MHDVGTSHGLEEQPKKVLCPRILQRSHRSMLLVAGLTLKNLKPRVWDVSSPYYLSNLRAVMVSYADFHRLPAYRHRAMAQGLHASLGIPKHIKVYLDNGAFYFLGRGTSLSQTDYEEFIA
jgi:7-cyano-7-deazaguanine tRNA-ribosyltransferase